MVRAMICGQFDAIDYTHQLWSPWMATKWTSSPPKCSVRLARSSDVKDANESNRSQGGLSVTCEGSQVRD
ncbi:hypothetical protein RRG08_042942 [Elysia crispata]|uniref:Uncharacterized protein n=1 Tax=Elysia crispata TaxID=231223 RepID=A0AAE1E5Z8_9GAST|nr:hypothetical protein RRG08_042942 [Elysia crispata]